MSTTTLPLTGTTVNTLAEHYGLSRRTVQRWLYDGFRGVRLQSSLLGNRRVVSQHDMEVFLRDIQRRDSDKPSSSRYARDTNASGVLKQFGFTV